ncbi:tyrosine-type recombinase/integrase [Haloterrigena alkaliphila]|uniref:Tyrosine-type recombinase/integrase n=1 Tax=Haloterrigena alkaliphila TaxID=2816475 RepID=A0A8A2VJ19_9EURY|nr:tyrosine-type recombinase/integrase [Haloterrigena alkaliphila]QSX00456.1 site-specific integrase [Haloterrigena alkaliphila]
MANADPREEVDTLRKRLEGSGEDRRYVQFDVDRHHLLKMSDNIRLTPSQIGEHRHLKLLRHCTRMAQVSTPPSIEDFEDNDEAVDAGVENNDDVDRLLEEHGLLGLALEYRAAAEAIVRWIHNEYTNEHTNQDYRTALRSFGRYRLKRDEPPESLHWIPTGTSNDFNPVPSERDLLRFEEDIQPMLDACRNPRDRALIAVQFEAGLRGGELWNLRIGDIFDSDHSVGIHSDGKRGEKPVHLIMSVPYLQKWLNEHPTGDDDQAYLWTKLDSPGRPSRSTWYGYFKGPAKRAGVTKDVHPTNLRKSNTRWLIKLGMSTARIEDRQGRKRGSEHTARYLARFGAESNERAYAKLHGIEVDEEEDENEVGPVECPRCHRETPRHEDFCVWCHHALSFEATEDVDNLQDDMFTAAGEADESQFNDLEEARRLISENPALRRVLLNE